MTSPGAKVIASLRIATSDATSKIISVVVASCTILPLSRVCRRRPLAPAGSSSVGDEARAEAARAVEILADGPLRRLHLIVAHRGIVEDRIAGDIVERARLGDIAPAAAHDRDQLALVIQLVRHAGPQDRRAMADQARGDAVEDRRICRRGEAALGRMIGIVQADADDLGRVLERRQEPDGGPGPTAGPRSSGGDGRPPARCRRCVSSCSRPGNPAAPYQASSIQAARPSVPSSE